MNARILILAALPREIAPLVRDWPVRDGSRSGGFMIGECDRAIAICAGIGRERVAHALSLAMERGPLSSVISVGYAGALRAGIARGTVHWPDMVIDAHTGERYLCRSGKGTLITEDRVLNSGEKPQIAERWHADLVDMEAATAAHLAHMHDLPFRTLKVVSDEMNDILPDFNRFIDDRGQFCETAFAFHVAVRPWLIPAAVRMGRSASLASAAIAKELREVIEDAE